MWLHLSIKNEFKSHDETGKKRTAALSGYIIWNVGIFGEKVFKYADVSEKKWNFERYDDKIFYCYYINYEK